MTEVELKPDSGTNDAIENDNHKVKLDHAIFDADIHGQSANMVYLARIFSWLAPHKKLATVSVLLVVAASFIAVLLPVLISRVVIDNIIIGQADLVMPDFGLNSLMTWTNSIYRFSYSRSPLVSFMVCSPCCVIPSIIYIA